MTKILMVDDDAHIRELVQLFLEKKDLTYMKHQTDCRLWKSWRK